MKALILAGGRGTRLRPLTHTSNKHMLPIGNKPMIYRVIEDAIDLGIKDIVININKGDEEMKRLINEGNKNWKVKLFFIEQPKPNGMMYPIKLAKDIIGNEPFFFSAGDNILSGGLKKHLQDFKKNNSDGHVLVVKRPDYKQFGVAILNKNKKVIKFVEKPNKPISKMVLTAIYFFKPVVFEAMNHVKPIDPKNTGKPEYYPPVVNNWLIDNGYKFTVSEVTGWWKDTGKPEDLIEANQLVLDRDLIETNKAKVDRKTKIQGRVCIESDVIIKKSILRGPLSIKKGSIIENSYIGPYTSIGENCQITNTEIENSIILGDASIKNHSVRIDSSIFGWNCDVTGSTNGSSNNFYIGDNSKINLI